MLFWLEKYKEDAYVSYSNYDTQEKAGMSQLQLAQKLNVSPSTIGMYEQGRRIPALDILIKMANLFGVSLDYLITGREIYNFGTDTINTVIQSACPCRVCCSRCRKRI